ncbi:MAG TPA: TraB/GumN family protein [Acidobacteriota bacterium]|nr:TraB/GumN family protein [Acidobacteriota bacterium]
MRRWPIGGDEQRDDPQQPENGAAEPEAYPSDQVQFLEIEGRTLILVGTAHVSRESADLVRRVIEREEPDAVCVELDVQRYKALTQERRWESLDLREIIRNKQLSALIVNLMLFSYQKRLGMKLGVMPGTELLEAVKAAEQQDIPVHLCDRDVKVTLRRAWRCTPLHKKFMLLASILASLFDDRDISEEQLQEILKGDVISELMKELGEAMPSLKTVLIDERDTYLAQRIKETEGRRIACVVGAGHLKGIRRLLESGAPSYDLKEINTIPPASPVWKWIGWAIPVIILGSIAYIGYTQGAEKAGDNALYWFLANAIPSGIGAALALGHPLAVAAAALSAPFTSLTPLIGAAYVTAFVQAYLRPPRVHEFKSVAEDLTKPSRWWRSRLLRIFLVFLFSGLGSLLGSWVGLVEIVSNLGG